MPLGPLERAVPPWMDGQPRFWSVQDLHPEVSKGSGGQARRCGARPDHGDGMMDAPRRNRAGAGRLHEFAAPVTKRQRASPSVPSVGPAAHRGCHCARQPRLVAIRVRRVTESLAGCDDDLEAATVRSVKRADGVRSSYPPYPSRTRHVVRGAGGSSFGAPALKQFPIAGRNTGSLARCPCIGPQNAF